MKTTLRKGYICEVSDNNCELCDAYFQYRYRQSIKWRSLEWLVIDIVYRNRWKGRQSDGCRRWKITRLISWSTGVASEVRLYLQLHLFNHIDEKVIKTCFPGLCLIYCRCTGATADSLSFTIDVGCLRHTTSLQTCEQRDLVKSLPALRQAWPYACLLTGVPGVLPLQLTSFFPGRKRFGRQLLTVRLALHFCWNPNWCQAVETGWYLLQAVWSRCRCRSLEASSKSISLGRRGMSMSIFLGSVCYRLSRWRA